MCFPSALLLGSSRSSVWQPQVDAGPHRGPISPLRITSRNANRSRVLPPLKNLIWTRVRLTIVSPISPPRMPSVEDWNSERVLANGELGGEACPKLSPTDMASTHKMDRSLAHSIAWRAITNWASQILSWASLLIVVRLLAPADFGIAAMALIIFPYLRYLSEIGIPATVVTFRDMSEDQLAQLNTVGLVFALAFFGVAATLA